MIEYFDRILHTLQKAMGSLDEEQFNKLVSDCYNAVLNGNKVIVSGLGKNVPICEKFVGTLNSLGINASFLHTNSAVHGDLGIIKSGDVVILLSKSGNTAETLILLEHVLKRDVTIWSITFSNTGKLYGLCSNNILIDMEHEGDSWNMVPNNSTTINLIVLQGLAMQLADKLNITLAEFRRNHPGGNIGELLRSGVR